MKARGVLVLCVAAFGLLALPGAGAMPFFMGGPGGWEASPALAALLSLVPVPVAVGQFYAGDWASGLLFSFLETAEAATAVGAFLYEGGAPMYAGVPFQRWDVTGQTVFVSAVGGFILTKFVDAFLAASAAEASNRKLTASRVSLDVRDQGVGLSFGFCY